MNQIADASPPAVAAPARFFVRAQVVGAPHEAMYMQRFVHWIVHEDGFASA